MKTFDAQSSAKEISREQPENLTEQEKLDIVSTLQSYKREGEEARKTGFNPRDDKWSENLNLYWNRHDFSRKASWQAKEVMPEVPSYVDRFAAALREALMAAGPEWYNIDDPGDVEQDLAASVKKMTDIWLTQVGTSPSGMPLAYPFVFEEQMKLGSLMATSNVVTWKDDVPGGRVAIDTVDPRFVWFDPTGRNLYRFRRIELDRHELEEMLEQTDNKGRPLFDMEQMGNLISGLSAEDKISREELAGNSQEITSARNPVVLDEYVATVVDTQGKKSYKKALFVVANDRHLIRGPETNPFWHGKDWLVYAPLVTVPLSPYGRSYMEDFGSLSRTFTNLTNLLLDATYTSSLNSWAIVVDMLQDPNQLKSGMKPNKLWKLQDVARAGDFIQKIEVGQLPKESVKMWELMKNELAEAAKANEIGLGQFAPHPRTSATEVLSTQNSSSALVRSVAETAEVLHINPTVDLVWKTGLQHMKPDDKVLQGALGPDMYRALYMRRKELIKRPFTFQATGISRMIQKAQKLKALLAILQVITSSEVLAQKFIEKFSIDRLLTMILELSDVDYHRLQATEREAMISQIAGPLQNMAVGGKGGKAGPGEGDMSRLNSMMNVGG